MRFQKVSYAKKREKEKKKKRTP